MQIVLVKPCWRYPISGADHTYNRRWPPLELLNAGALLETDGHQVRLVDAQAENLRPEEVARRARRADMIVVTSSALDRWQCPTLELEPLVNTTAALRSCTKHLVLTGFHGTVQPKAMLDMTGVDAVICGEPEMTVRELAAGGPWEHIAGLALPRHGDCLLTPERPPLDLTRLPAPAFHLLDLRHYRYEVLGGRFIVLEASRGCPHPCTYCPRTIQGKTMRRKTPDQVAREVEQAVRQFGVRNIYFIDLEFTAVRESVVEICELLIARRIAVRWCCQTRTDQVDEPLLRLMRTAGCRLVHFGVEFGSPRVAAVAKKPIPQEQHHRSIVAAHRVGIETLAFFLLGYPGETEEEMRQTLRLACELNPTYAAFHRIAPYPDTAIYQATCTADGQWLKAFAGSDQDRQLVDRLVRQGLRSFYLRPRYMLSRLWCTPPSSLWRQLQVFAGYFRRS